MSQRRRMLVLVVLVGLAGCGGLTGSAEPTQTETLTPPAVPEAKSVAPGVPTTDGGPTVIDGARLLAADEAQRASTSYRLTRTVHISGDNWTTRIDRERRVAADGAVFERVVIDSAGPLSASISRSELWTNGSTAYVRTFDASGTRIEQGAFPSAPSHFRRWLALRAQVLEGGNYRITETTEGAILQSRTLPTLPATVVPLSVREPRNVSARVVVTEAGLIRAITVRYVATVSGERVSVQISHRLRGVGNTTVTRPEWSR